MVGDGQHGGADNFWPGYVDAISNLVLNLLFVVAILTIAVFLFAIELGRKQGIKVGAVKEDKGVPVKTETLPQNPEKTRLEEELNSLRQQVSTLKKEKAAAKVPAPVPDVSPGVKPAPEEAPRPTTADAPAARTEKGDSAVPDKTVAATQILEIPEKDVEKIDRRGGVVVIDFTADAVAMSTQEAADARKALGPVVSSGGARLEVVVKGSFSEARRLAFYRAMSVRNLLIEMGLPADRIDLAIREVKKGGDSTKVLVHGK